MPSEVRYKRSRFSTRLPEAALYTRSHFWLAEVEPGLWRAGFTKFAVRMLGELVDHQFEVLPGGAMKVGQIIGWLEGFKAVTDLYSVLDGEFVGGNPALEGDLTLLDSAPYDAGWLFLARGQPEPGVVDVHGYVNVLDATIDRMLGVVPPGGAT